MPRWSVQIIGGKHTEFLGFVSAANEQKALAEAVRVFQIHPDWQTRVIVFQLKASWIRWLRGAR
jgi:hypothetical protein